MTRACSSPLMYVKGFLRVKKKKNRGSRMRPCTNRPDRTVMKYMPSFSPRWAGSCISRIFPATRNTMPNGKYLHGGRESF